MRRSLTLQLFILTAALAGCAALHPKVEDAGDGAYHLSATGTRVNSQTDVNLRAVSDAIDYCGSMGKQMLFRSSHESGEHSWSAKREDLTFVCMSGADPAYMNAGLKKDEVLPPAPIVALQ
jgi:hypothetical protein